MIFRAGTLKDKTGTRIFDKRVRERHLASGALEPKQIDKHLASLHDVEANGEHVDTDQPALGER